VAGSGPWAPIQEQFAFVADGSGCGVAAERADKVGPDVVTGRRSVVVCRLGEGLGAGNVVAEMGTVVVSVGDGVRAVLGEVVERLWVAVGKMGRDDWILSSKQK